MTKLIGSIESITPCSDWWSTDDGVTFEPIACWATINVIEPEYVSLGAKKYIVGVVGEELGREIDLGSEVFRRRYVHLHDFEVVGELLKDDREPRGGS
jgi:hypothetical protein